MDGASLPGHRYLAPVHSRLLTVSIVAALAISACAGSDDADSGPSTDATTDATTAPVESTDPPVDTASPTTEAPVETASPIIEPIADELEPIGRGPYDVGVSTITINAGTERPLTVDVWFPIADAGGAPLHQYTLIPGVYYESPEAVTATPDQIAPGGPFPMVVYSHGSGGLRYIASDYTETIASYGYIVAAPDHTGNTAADQLLGTNSEFDQNAIDRPNDVKAVIDALLDPTRTETAGFVANVDPEDIAVTGHSFGGFTTLALAGGYTNTLGTFAADPRVDALIPLAPATGSGDGRLLSDADLAAITTPMLLMVGTADTSTPADPNVTRPWELSASDPMYRVDLVDAQHNSFTDICQYQEFLPTLGEAVPAPVIETIDAQAEEGCAPETMASDRAHELTNTFAIAFLESIFRGTEMIDDETTTMPDDVVFTAR